MENYDWLFITLLVFFLFASSGIIIRISMSRDLDSQDGITEGQQLFRQWRNRRAEEEMILMLNELGWPEAVEKMTAEEVAHQLCNRLAVRLWNRPITVTPNAGKTTNFERQP